MKAKRYAIIVLLAGLALLVVVAQFWPADKPTYQGKAVSVWFEEYAFATNAPIRKRVLGHTIDGRVFVMQPASKGDTIIVEQVSTNRPNWAAELRARFEQPPPDPAWEALQSLGSNAVPCLVKHLRYGTLDRAYETVVTNLPAFVQRRLPSPTEKRWLRIRALQTLAMLKDSARGATPALLDLLRKPEPLLRAQVLSTLRSIYADRHSISGLLLQLGEQKRYAEVLEIARETRWEGREIAHLFGEILQSPNTTLHRDAITLLEAAGNRAAPALDAILAALESPDREVRYLSTRTLEKLFGSASSEAQTRIEAALRARLDDANEMVRKVARRTLQRK